MDHEPADTLRHHGDADAEPGLLDFAVNVQGSGPPAWLRERLAATLDGLGRYPAAAHDARAREAVAARHGRRPEEVLVLAGSAEGGTARGAPRPRGPPGGPGAGGGGGPRPPGGPSSPARRPPLSPSPG